MATKDSRCWPGYEPVPGKKQHEQGSCRKKAASKSTPSEQEFQTQRKKQLDNWEKEHPGARRSAAQHLGKPKKAAAKKAAAKKRPASRKK
jgi:hypothetical protein